MSDECKRGGKKALKPLTEAVEKNSNQCDILDTMNVTYYIKCSRMFHSKLTRKHKTTYGLIT